MVEIRDRVEYIAANDAVSTAANNEFKTAIVYVTKYLNENFKTEDNNLVVFQGKATTVPSDDLDLWWEVDSKELENAIIQALTEFDDILIEELEALKLPALLLQYE